MLLLTLRWAGIRQLRVLVYRGGLHEGGGGSGVLLHCHHLRLEDALRDNRGRQEQTRPTGVWAGLNVIAQ